MVKTILKLRQSTDKEIKAQIIEAHQWKLLKRTQSLAGSFLKSPLATASQELFEKEATRFCAEIPDEETAREAIMVAIEIRLQLQCRCGSRSFNRKPGKSLASCTNCPRSISLTARCPLFKNLHKTRLLLGLLQIKSRCGFFSIKRFAEFFGYSYNSCFEQSKKIDNILIEYSKSLEGMEGMDSALFSACWTHRSAITPAGLPLASEQNAVIHEEKLARAEAERTKPRDVSHLPCEIQTVYKLLSDTPTGFDSLMCKSGQSVGTLSNNITILEIENLLESRPGNSFVLKRDKEKPAAEKPTADDSEHGDKAKCVLHRKLAQTLMPVFRLREQGTSRRHFERAIIDVWRVLTISASGRPIDLMSIIIKFGDTVKTRKEPTNCPLKIKIPFVTTRL